MNGVNMSMHTCGKGVILALPLGQYPFMDTARQVAPTTRASSAVQYKRGSKVKAYKWRIERCRPVLRV